MDQKDFIDGLLRVGSLVGLATGVFVLFDRLVRSRPRAWIAADKLGSHAFPVIVVRNLDAAPIFVRGISSKSGRYGVARDNSVRGIARAMTGHRLDAVVPGQSEMVFQLIEKISDEMERSNSLVKFRISWRRASAPLIWQFPVNLRVRPSGIEELKVSVRSAPDDRED